MTKRIENLAGELRRGLHALYASRLVNVLVFGSHAREEADVESDLDVLVVLDCIDHYAAEVDRVGQLISDLSLAYGVSVSPVFVSEAEWLHGESAFLANVREETVPA